MKIEHFALQVEKPAEVAQWYCDSFGFTIKRAADSPVCVRFLADSCGDVMLEIYNNPRVKTPNYAEMDPLLVHVAFVCEDVDASIARLEKNGATLVVVDHLPNGDILAMMRDPWGLAIQLAKRPTSML